MILLMTILSSALVIYLVGFWSTKQFPTARLFRFNQSPDIHITEPKQTMLHSTLAAKFQLHNLVAGAATQSEKLSQLTQWVHQLWEPKPGRFSKSDNPLTIINRAENGERFSRHDYNTVLANAMMAVGIPTRLTTLRTRDCALRPLASALVGIEYFDLDHFKWAWFDGKYGIRVLHNNIPLNALEIKEAIHNASMLELQPDFAHIDIDTYCKTLSPYLDIIVTLPLGQAKQYALIPPQLSIPRNKFWFGKKLYDTRCHAPMSFYASHPIKQLTKPKKTQAIDIRTRRPITI